MKSLRGRGYERGMEGARRYEVREEWRKSVCRKCKDSRGRRREREEKGQRGERNNEMINIIHNL